MRKRVFIADLQRKRAYWQSLFQRIGLKLYFCVTKCKTVWREQDLYHNIYTYRFMKVRIKNFNHRWYRWLVYTILWGWLWAFPVVATIVYVVRGKVVFSWDYILPTWLAILPFFLLFLVHHLILRIFLPRKMMRTYVLVALLLLSGFCAIRYIYQYPRNLEGRIMSPPSQTGRDKMGIEEMREGPDSVTYAFPPIEFTERRERPKPPLPRPRRGLGDVSNPVEMPLPLTLDIIISLLILSCDFALVQVSRYQDEREEGQKLKATQLQHELQYLKAQIHPHFFMNMLNNIHGMIEIDPAKAQEMIMELSKLMRYVLYDGAQLFTSLQKEKEFITNYVNLMGKRYSPKKVSISLDLPQSDDEGVMVPSLLFISIIENAFKHGISYKNPSFVAIKLSVGQDSVELVCDNSVHEHVEGKGMVGGVGLSNLRQRLRLLFEEHFTLDIVPSYDKYHVKLIIPRRYEKDTMHRH